MEAQTRRLVLIAGPNGSGKSTLTRGGGLAQAVPLPPAYINADEIARSLRQEAPQSAPVETERAAFKRARELRQRYREEGVSVAIETVFSHPSTLLDMQKYRAAGYHITLIYAATENAEINVGRVATRVRQGGHDVPPDKVRDRYARSLRLLPRAVEEADEAFVYDTTDKARLCGRKYPDGRTRYVLLPAYMEHSLSVPLEGRAAERSQVSQVCDPAEVYRPDEEQGEYIGSFRHTLNHYGLQEISPATYYRHDLCLLASPLPPARGIKLNYTEGLCTATPIVP